MAMERVDIIIVGSGMSGLYSAYMIMQYNPSASFLILEKYKKQWIGGRTSNDFFYGTEIVTGAGIGRKGKDKMLYRLVHSLGLPSTEYMIDPQKIGMREDIELGPMVERLRKAYSDRGANSPSVTFKEFATGVLGPADYTAFIQAAGYTDYENEDAYETLYYYGLEDNACCWKAFTVPWKMLVERLYEHIGAHRFRFSNKVTCIERNDGVTPETREFTITTDKKQTYVCNKVIVATTIDGVRALLPKYPIYREIEGQPFLRLYAKFTKASIPFLKERVRGFAFVRGPLQRIIPMNADTGVYMIAYNDNKNAIALKPYLENTVENRQMYASLVERTLNIPNGSLHIIALKDFYWSVGTHYYKPLNTPVYGSRDEFIRRAQTPMDGMLVVGEAVSRNQGWTEGALESVKSVVTRKWVR